MEDTLGAMEDLYICAHTVLDILCEVLKVKREDVLETRKELPDEDDTLLLLKAATLAASRIYERRFGKEPPGARDIVPLTMMRRDAHDSLSFPTRELLGRFLENQHQLLDVVSEDVFELPTELVDYHLLIVNNGIRRIMTGCLDDILAGEYTEAIKKSSLAFSISLEEQRQRLNYLMERQELSTAMFFLDSPETLYYKLQDYSFILMALQVDLGKYRQFEKIVPTTMISEDGDRGTSITISDFVHEQWITSKWARYCFSFVCETVLLWQNMDLRKP